MKTLRSLAFFFLIAALYIACSTEPRPIAFGEEVCAYCKMTIVDAQHAAQIVSDKGKNFAFDAIECMVYYIDDNQDVPFPQQYVCNFEQPGQLLEAENSWFLISPSLPSPMGADLNAFATLEVAESMQQQHQGELFNWMELQDHLNK